MIKRTKKLFGYTIAEILILLIVLGILAIVVIPTLHNKIKWREFSTGVKKAKSTLDQALMNFSAENGTRISCGYWVENPYGGGAECKGYDNKGNCTGWRFKDSGNDLPQDYNGDFQDCKDLYTHMTNNLNTVKVCNSFALANGCVHDIDGIDSIYAKKHNDSSKYEQNKATTSLSGLRRNEIHNGKAFATADGMVFIPYNEFSVPIMLVDVNGHRGPNKWGFDIHAFVIQVRDKTSIGNFYPYLQSTAYISSGGNTTYFMLYGKRKI